MMQQLSPLDAVFLSMETRETPGHVGGLAILDPSTHPEQAFEYEGFLEFVAERLSLCPRFGWKLQEVPFGLDHPYWVEEDDLDLRRHVKAMALPAPGGLRELAELAGYLHEGVLDRSRPLWEMFYIEGLQGGRVALLWKVHHCLMDGVSGAGLVELLFDLQPVPAERPLVPVDEKAQAGERRGLLEIATRGVMNASQRPAALLRHATRVGTELVSQLREEGLEGIASAPRTPFNGVVGPRRSVAWSRISFERVKELKDALGVTVNDVVLTLTGEAVRRYLQSRDALPEESLVAAVPVSIRSAEDKSMGNQVSEMGITWGTDIEDPLERLYAVNRSSLHAKQSGKAHRVNPMEVMAEALLPAAVNWVSRLSLNAADQMPLPANAVVSNVPTSPVPIYIAGARIDGMVPMSLLAPTQGINITVVSYCGELHFGLIADPDLVDSVWEIAEGIPKALGLLESAAAAEPGASG